MEEMFCLVVGIILILLFFWDILLTTISMEGGGKVTDFLMNRLWRLFLFSGGYDGRRKRLDFAGMYMVVVLVLFWGMNLWVGVFLIFASNPQSIVHADTETAATLAEKFYYAGYVLTTMGLGDFKPINATWGILSSFFSFLGLVMITLVVSYILPVLSKEIERKQFSLFINNLGETPQELLLYFWNGKDFSSLNSVSKDLHLQILHISQSHLAYPILHYFHSSNKSNSLVVSLCLIDEALYLLFNHIAPDQWDEKEILPLWKALGSYLSSMEKAYKIEVHQKRNYTPEPNLDALAEARVRLARNQVENKQRSDLWYELLRSKGWSWNDIYPSKNNANEVQP